MVNYKTHLLVGFIFLLLNERKKKMNKLIFGYRRNQLNEVIIDVNAAEVVVLICEMYLEGKRKKVY